MENKKVRLMGIWRGKHTNPISLLKDSESKEVIFIIRTEGRYTEFDYLSLLNMIQEIKELIEKKV